MTLRTNESIHTSTNRFSKDVGNHVTNNFILDKSNLHRRIQFINSLHCAFYEGDISFICNYLDRLREENGGWQINKIEYVDVEIFYRHYLSQHPPDGILRTAQFIVAAIDRFC